MGKKRKTKISIWGFVLVLLLVGCSSKVSNTEVYDMAKQESTDVTEMATEDSASMSGQGTNVNLTVGTNLNRKIIKTGHIEIETKGFEDTINNVFQGVEQIGGFVENSQIDGSSYYDNTSRRYASISIRIPSNQFDAFINGADVYGNVVSKGMNGEDVTDAYVDTEARLRSLEVQRDRLIELLQKSGTLEEIFAIEKEYANVTYEIESLKGTLNKYDSLIDYSTINIGIREVQNYQNTKTATTLGERIAKAFGNSMQNLLIFGEEVLLFVVGLIPFVIGVGIPALFIAWILIRISRNIKRKHLKINKDENSKQDQEDK